MAIVINSEGKRVRKNLLTGIADFTKTAFQSIARETFSLGLESSKLLKGLDEKVTGGLFDFPTELEFEDENTIAGKTQRAIFGTPDDKQSIRTISKENEYLSDLLYKAYGEIPQQKLGIGISKDVAEKLGYGVGILFAGTNFLPTKSGLTRELIEEKSVSGAYKKLIREGVESDVAKSYAPFFAKATTRKEVSGLLKQVDDIVKSTTRVAKENILEVPPKTAAGKISIRVTEQSAKDVQHLITLRENALKTINKIMMNEREQILKSNFKSLIQKQQEEFSQKLVSTIKKFKESGENVKSIKNDLFLVAKNSFPDGELKSSLVKKIVEAETPSDVRKTIMAISTAKDKSIRKELISSVKNAVSISDNLTINQRDKMLATISNIRLRGFDKSTIEKINNMKRYFNNNPEKELLLGKKNTKLLERAEDLSKVDINKLSTDKLRELERRLSYIVEASNLERKTRTETRKLQNEIIIDSIARDSHNLDTIGKIESVARDLTIKEKVNNFWVSFKENAKKGNWSWISADNFFSELGETSKKVFKDTIDKVSNNSKRDYAKIGNRIIGFEADLEKKYGYKLGDSNFERIMIHAIAEQKGGLNKLLATEGFTKEFVNSIWNNLTPQELEWYNFARKELDDLFPKIDEVLIKTTMGERRLGNVENYFPMIVDFTKSDKLADLLFDDSYFIKRGTSKGFTKTRGVFGLKSAAYNMNARDVFFNYARKANDFINMEDSLKQLQEIASSDKLRKSLGKDATSFIEEYLDTISRGGISKNYKRGWFEDVRDNVGSAILGFGLSPILKQPIAKITSGTLLGPDHTFKHDVEFISNKLNGIVDEISMQQKFRAFDDPSFDVAGLNKYQQWGYAGIKYLDKITSNNVWYAAYKKYFADKNIKFNLEDFKNKIVDEDAVKYADEIVRKTQGTGEIKDMAQMFRGDNRGFWKSVFQFQSFILNQFQLLSIDMKNAILKEKNSQKALNILTFFTLAGMAESYVSAGLTSVFGTEKQKEYQEMSPEERLADSFFGQVPLINNIISVSKFGGSGIPVIDTAGDIIRGGTSVVTGKKAKTKLKGAVTATTGATSIAGIPGSRQLAQWLNNAISSMDEEESQTIDLNTPSTRSTKTRIKRASF